MRIGILGGTFNPVHSGHIAIAEEALKQLELERIIFIPAYIPPHKGTSELADAEDRFKMLELALAGKDSFEISRFEIERHQASYSIETIEFIRGSYPEDTELLFLLGEDALTGLDTWKDIDRLLKLCGFVAFNRPGFENDKNRPHILRIEIAPIEISSTMIREKIKTGESITGLLPEVVEEYIVTNNLYK